MTEYIERNVFIESQRHLYCNNCERRKGMKNGKMKFVYDIGEVPCRACDIEDVLDAVEDFPAAEVRPVVRGKWISADDGKTIVHIINGVPRYSCKCSVCGDWLVASDEYDIKGNFCPNCGAMMEES